MKRILYDAKVHQKLDVIAQGHRKMSTTVENTSNKGEIYVQRTLIPNDYFCVTSALQRAIEEKQVFANLIIKENKYPDISLGSMFAKHLRRKGIDVNKFMRVKLHMNDGRVLQNVLLYPNYLEPEFNEYLLKIWLPSKMLVFFEKNQSQVWDLFSQNNAA